MAATRSAVRVRILFRRAGQGIFFACRQTIEAVRLRHSFLQILARQDILWNLFLDEAYNNDNCRTKDNDRCLLKT